MINLSPVVQIYVSYIDIHLLKSGDILRKIEQVLRTITIFRQCYSACADQSSKAPQRRGSLGRTKSRKIYCGNNNNFIGFEQTIVRAIVYLGPVQTRCPFPVLGHGH